MLPSVPEGSVAESAVAVSSGVRLGSRRPQAPWQSPAVREIAQRAGKADDATPMLLEGPVGTVMAAVGESRDHAIASRALSDAMQGGLQEKLRRAEQEKRMLQHKVQLHKSGGPSPTVQPPAVASDRRLAVPGRPSGRSQGGASSDGGVVARTAGGGPMAMAPGRSGPSFGAVYEYRDSVGRPQYVAGTAEMPEAAFANDYHDHAGVRRLFEGPSEAHGRAKVVWVGVGGGPCGQAEMHAARSAVASERAARQRIHELAGAKPYSRHAHMLCE